MTKLLRYDGRHVHETEFDVVIIGGRVAGAGLAILLGRQGRRVLLVDRDRFPSDTLSTHYLHPSGVELLARLGVLADVEAAGFRRITRQRTYVGDVIVEGAVRAPGAYALCPRRSRLDMTLIEHAMKQASVTVWQSTRAEGLIWEDGRVAGVHLRKASGRRVSVCARVVVGADGKNSSVAGWVDAQRYDEVPALRPIYYAYYRDVEPLPEATGEVFYIDDRIGYIMPMEPGIDCLVLELQTRDFDAFRADPGGRFDVAFRALPGMARRMGRAERQGPVYGTRGVENYLRVPYGPGWALTGDAAYCKDPSTGTGIEDALRGGFLLADALGDVLDGADWEATMAGFHRLRDDIFRSAYRGTLAHSRAPEIPAASLAWLEGVAATPGFVRALAMNFPAIARSPDVFPGGLLAAIERSARLFGAAAEDDEAQKSA
ncbi:MAG: NAD(P)/FAD-dependent oxidoreductase [Dehalococcoidia bacterium]